MKHIILPSEVDALQAARHRIVDAMLADLYRNPFWEARYGEQGRVRAREDGHYHINSLIIALRVDGPDVSFHYAAWLRSVLTARGISTLHLRDTFAALQRQLEQTLPESWPRLEKFVLPLYQGLGYRHPVAARLEAHQEEIIEAVTLRLYAPEAGLGLEPTPEKLARCRRDNAYHLCYLLDAIEKENPRLFAQYRQWIVGFLEPHGVEPRTLEATFALLREEALGRLEGRAERQVVEETMRIAM